VDGSAKAVQGGGQVGLMVSVQLAGRIHFGQKLQGIAKVLGRRFRGGAKTGAGATVEGTASLAAAAPIGHRAPLDGPSSHRLPSRRTGGSLHAAD